MITPSGIAVVIWLVFLYPIFYTTSPNVEVKKPSLNLKIDLENMKMTWDSNVTVAQCSVDTPFTHRNYDQPSINRKCQFDSVPLHKGANFTAKIQYMNQTLSESIYFPPEEMDGTSAENFSCVLYNVSSVNCTWNAGRNAPEDVQYFLYLKYIKNRREQKRQCPHYINNTVGRNIACHIPEITLYHYDNNIYYFKVNGSSKKSQIRYYDEHLALCSHEILGPPQNISTNCSDPLLVCRKQWTPPLNSDLCCCFLKYEIKDETKNTTEDVTNNYIDVEEKRILRIRMIKRVFEGGFKSAYKIIYGKWSEQIILDLPSNPIPPAIITLIYVALGTILLILILVFVCKRYHIWQKLTNPVPQPKNLFQQYTKNTEKEWVDSLPAAHEPDEKITFIEEVTDSLKK